jgi:TRAP-type C4-dicarboxylate transport system permease large subunit
MAGLLVIGCIMETTASLILLVPVLAAITPQMGVDPIQFGVLMVINLAVGMLTPPVGICLFVSCGISGVSLGQASRAAMPLVAVAIAALLISCYWPPLITWFPSLIYK